jgi:hypothetical protein
MWVKLDEHFPEHPKVIAAGPLAGWLYVAGLCYANRLLTDGFIPRDLVTRLLPKNGHKPETLARKLCEVGLWIETAAAGVPGYRIHDYTRYQPTKKRVLSDRKQSAKRVARWRKT